MKIPKYLIPVLLLTVVLSLKIHGDPVRGNYKPSGGYVPDAETAKKIAEAIWIPIYGKKIIDSEKPFRASLTNEVWVVEGSYKLPKDKADVHFGGVAVAAISKDDGRILRVSHGL